MIHGLHCVVGPLIVVCFRQELKCMKLGFGDEELAKPHTEYSSFRIRLVVSREASGLFWKMFLGMYLAFLISYVCFYIHADGMDSRFGLTVGALFAVIGNKYIIDSAYRSRVHLH